MAEQMLRAGTLQDPAQQRDLIYLLALCKYKLGYLLEAKDQISEFLKVRPPGRSHCLSSALLAQGLCKVGCTLLHTQTGTPAVGTASNSCAKHSCLSHCSGNMWLQVSPNSRQGKDLKSLIDEATVKEGLTTIGIGAVVAVGVGAVAAMLLRRR